MKDFFQSKSWLTVFLMYAVAIAAAAAILTFGDAGKEKIVLAGTGDNVSGWAWNSNIGWISFNSKECDTDDNGYIDSGNCGGDNATTPAYSYGVNIDGGTGDFSGYGWSASVGWIDFAPTSGFPGSPNTGVHYDSATGDVTGWAKILSLGSDGWIKMSDDSVAVWNGKGVKIDGASGEFSGYAWNGDDSGAGIGWISFSCSNDNSCATVSYKVSRAVSSGAPSAVNLTAPNWSISQACSLYARQAFLRWEFSDPDVGATQSAYQVMVDDTSNFSSPIIDTGKTAGAANQLMLGEAELSYNTAYYWKVKVWDEHDTASAWAQYNSPTDTDNDDGNNFTFTAYKHEMPDVNFSWSPANPNINEETQFTDASQVYLTAAPGVAVACDDANCDWLWTAAGAVIDSPAASTTIITFNAGGSQSVTLRVTDVDGYYCEKTENINVGSELPTWKEVKPR
ncbi:hypothetical protein HY798_02035 [Candidatus Falkowbacteria bacterium]|nr:hypothetical protein [Candidatus Falkowbacteria bacterium]